MAEWLRALLFKEESFETHINALCIKLDKIPNLTKETRETSQTPCVAHRIIARNILGRWLLRRRFNKGIGSMGSLTHDGMVLEIYPPLKEMIEGITNG